MQKSNDNLPEVFSLNPGDLIEWMRKRKSEMGLSNAKLAEMSGVPEGTIDRIMSKRYPEFRYTSIQPIMAVLVGYNENTPEPDPADDKQNKFYYNTIEGYKLAIENKNHEIDELRRRHEHLREEINFLKNSTVEKQRVIDRQVEHEKWLEQIVDELRSKLND